MNTAPYDEHGEFGLAADEVPELDVNDDLEPLIALEAVLGAYAGMSAYPNSVEDHEVTSGSSSEDGPQPETDNEMQYGGAVKRSLKRHSTAEVSPGLNVSETHCELGLLQEAVADVVASGERTSRDRRAAGKKLRHGHPAFRPGERWKERRLPRVL